MEQKKQICEGAEAKIYLKENAVVKERSIKKYRLKEIDERLRKFRTRREAKLLETLKKINFPAPRLLKFSDKTMDIEMECLHGKKARDVLKKENSKELCSEIGEKIGILHHNNIIHGDLTTSNMIIIKENVYFIDFGLSFFSHKTEDKAVDLHLLRQALESKHHRIWEECFSAALDGYKKANPQHKEIFERLKRVEKRGRHKSK